MMLLFDIGNTRLKWGWLRDGRLEPGGALAHRERGPDWVAALPAPEQPPRRILASNVAGAALARALDVWAGQRCGCRVEFLQAGREAGGVRNAYEQPELLGVDRWLGMIGAWQRVRAPLVCVAAGTALTVDAVDATGRHLGGWILPGRALLVESLRNGTADIARSESRATAEVVGSFGTNTAGAVAEGSWQALAAAASRAVRLVEDRTGVRPRAFIGGGDAEEILARLDVPAELAADLVLEGLAVVAGGE